MKDINEYRPPAVWVSRPQLAEFSGFCPATISRICKEMQRAGRKKGMMLSPAGRVLRVDVREFERFMSERQRWKK